MLDVGSQRILHRPARFQRSQDHVGSYGRTPEDFVAKGIRQRIQDRGASAAHRRLADAARADGRFRVGDVNGAPIHLVWNIQNCGRLGVMEAPRYGQAVLLVVHPFLADGVADAENRAAENLPAKRAADAGQSPRRRMRGNPECDTGRFRRRLRSRQTWRRKEKVLPSCGYLSFATASSPWPASAVADAAVNLLMSVGSSWPS